MLLRAQAVIQMTTNRCETTAKSGSGGTHGTRTYDALRSLVSYMTLANHATAATPRERGDYAAFRGTCICTYYSY